jgi:16S rRNA G1207 methylase RsmC
MSFVDNLVRIPLIKNDPLKAWDAADEYLVSSICTDTLPKKTLIINDNFGALACNFSTLQPQLWSDSYLSKISCEYNLQKNNLDDCPFIPATQHLNGLFDLVIMRLPKSLELLEQQLFRLRAVIHSDTQIIAAGMVKHWPKQARKLFEQYIGTTDLSLTKKKARLLHATVTLPKCNEPMLSGYQVEENKLTLSADANVFGSQKQDLASHLTLKNLHLIPHKDHYLDLGCGNGIIGCSLLQQYPQASVTFIDESFQAVECSKNNTESNALNNENCNFVAGDSLTSQPNNSADIIFCNPPFHQQHSISDHIAWGMFEQAKHTLTKDGELWVIGNRHLGYHSKLKKLFKHCTTVDSDSRFVLLKASN